MGVGFKVWVRFHAYSEEYCTGQNRVRFGRNTKEPNKQPLGKGPRRQRHDGSVCSA